MSLIEILKETKEKYGINLRIFLDKKKKKERWIFESLDKLTIENSKSIDAAKKYAADRLTESQYQELLDKAKSDLKASEVLCGEKLYPEAVYAFQQSVEKTAKAYVIIIKYEPFTENEFRAIGHEAYKIYKKYIIPATEDILEPYNTFIKGTLEPYNLIKGTPSIKTDIDLELDSLDDFSSLIRDLEKEYNDNEQNLIYMNIENGLSLVTKKYKDLEDQKDKIGLETIKRYLAKIVFYHNPRAEIDPKKLDEIRNINGLEKLVTELYINDRQTEIYLIFLSIITLPHDAFTRYPKADLTISPKIYTKNLSIVEKLPELINIQSKLLYKLEELIRIMKEILKGIRMS